MVDYMFAYATNIDQEEMQKHCPNAIFRGYATLEGYALDFQGYTGHAIATLKKDKKSSVNVAVWEMTPEDYYTIDNFEKFPYIYHREHAKVLLMGRKVKGSVYLLKNKLQSSMPSEEYLQALRKSFDKAGWSHQTINDALKRMEEQKSDEV